MSVSAAPSSPARWESRLAVLLFAAALAFHGWAMTVGWESRNLPGVEYRQAQTALSAHFIKVEGNFSPAYPTPVLGKPWSIPMEFPLYQWTVVITSHATGWGITKAGRAVNIACFYLTLPAVFLLLAWWRVAPAGRWLVLTLLVTCPFYIFYTRGVFIENMALMFAVWFSVAFSRAVTQRSRAWLAFAALTGAAAGAVKVTTLMLHLAPLAVWSLRHLWVHRAGGRWRAELAWMAAALAVPFLATLGWTRYADAVKARNPLADFLLSANLLGFNLGTHETRLSPALWAMKWRIVREELLWLPLVGGAILWTLVAGRARLAAVTGCLAVFALALVVFPELYAYHEYYYAANLVWLLLGVGLALVALLESPLRRGVVWSCVAMAVAVQVGFYFQRYYPSQRALSPGGDGVSHALRALTRPEEVIVVTGQDWNSMIPYYAQRRAVMLRSAVENQPAVIARALAAVADEPLGALLVTGPVERHRGLVDLLRTRGLTAEPVFVWRDVSLYLPEERVPAALAELQARPVSEVVLAPGRAFAGEGDAARLDLGGRWHVLAGLPPEAARRFDGMEPRPVRFFASYPPTLERAGGAMDFGAHPVTRLVFALPAGRHRLVTSLRFSPDAFGPQVAETERTDGVQLRLARLDGAEPAEVFFDRVLDPGRRESDRRRLMIRVAFTLAAPAEVELFVGPGPAGRDTRDWVVLGPTRFEPAERLTP